MARRSRFPEGGIARVPATRQSVARLDRVPESADVGAASARIVADIQSILGSSPTGKELLALYAAVSGCLIQINGAFVQGILEAQTPQPSQLLTVEEAAQVLNIDPRALYRKVPHLSCVRRVGRLLRFDRYELLKEFKVGPR